MPASAVRACCGYISSSANARAIVRRYAHVAAKCTDCAVLSVAACLSPKRPPWRVCIIMTLSCRSACELRSTRTSMPHSTASSEIQSDM
eukprot:76114-Rhodomonas_salina.1